MSLLIVHNIPKDETWVKHWFIEIEIHEHKSCKKVSNNFLLGRSTSDSFYLNIIHITLLLL